MEVSIQAELKELRTRYIEQLGDAVSDMNIADETGSSNSAKAYASGRRDAWRLAIDDLEATIKRITN
jgi:hypothetical protein